ncbi:MAG: tetratricopeptide repeat protein [Hydrogenophilales bacterium]|nr:tetratricopeptide repeat protein [Hydrogenophilales bacterium]
MLIRLFKNLFSDRSSAPGKFQPITGSLLDILMEGFDAYTAGDFDQALTIAQSLSKELPKHPDILLLEGISLVGLGQTDKAIPILKQLVTVHPEIAGAWKALGEAADKTAQPQLMLDCYHESLVIDPKQPDLETKLGIFMMAQRRYQEARAHFERALAIVPSAAGYHNLGCALITYGRPDLAYDALVHALRLDPGLDASYRGITGTLLYLTFSPEENNREIYAGYSASVRRAIASETLTEFALSPHSGRINIGYVTSDFRLHPVTANMLPILARHDRLQFEIHAYAYIEKPDTYTAECQTHVDQWHDIHGMTDHDIAAQIHSDKIDVLVILAGRFDNNRPRLCMYRCAPVNISFHDAATSGLDQMDYLISDITMSPRNTREWFSERVIHLPTFYLHDPIAEAPEITPPPAQTKGYITFGSCNNPAKLNPQVFSLWARVLKRLPDSRLILKYFGRFNEEDVRTLCLSTFREHEIDPDRIKFLDDFNDRASHLKVYQHIDIALDPFPFTGSTTTFEALWMGVPVVTLTGQTMVGRWSTSMLRRIGHPEWIAHDDESYISICQTLAENLDQLGRLRHALREEVRQSPLCDADRRTRQIERIYRHVVSKWRAKQAADSDMRAPLPDMLTLDIQEEAHQILAWISENKSGQAAESLEKLLLRINTLDDSEAESLNEMAVGLIDCQQLFLASRVLHFLKKLKPNLPSVLCNLGIVNSCINQFTDAQRFFKEALELAPKNAATLYNYSVALTQQEHYPEAHQYLRQLLEQQPDHLGAYLQLAEIERESGDINQAISHARRATELAPNDPATSTCLGNMLRDAGQIHESIEAYQQALSLQPNSATAQLGLAFVYLLQERYSEGWTLYEARKKTAADRTLQFPVWNFEAPLHDKTLLVYGEQGLGDDIMFASCYHDLIDKSGRLIIDCEPRLRDLYARSFPQALVVGSPRYGAPTWLGKTPKIDYQVAAGSLPQYFRQTREQFPDHHGYLNVDPLRIEAWHEKLHRLGRGLKVGISWKGGLGKTRGLSRSIPLNQWAPILSQANCHFISLQPGKTASDLEAMAAEGYEIAYWEDAITDVNETAALISTLDLVISVCGTVVHLGGALGKPVWILSPPVPEWRYTLVSNHMSWYPTAEIFRAKADYQWFDVLDTASQRLADLANQTN